MTTSKKSKSNEKKNSLKTVYFQTRSEWRSWLSDHFEKEDEIWLIFPKKSSDKTGILYNDAVEEALCFGWIDSTVKTLDEHNRIQRFSRRKPKSSYSQPNIERLKWLKKQNLIHPEVLKSVEEVIAREFVFPKDILREIQKDPVVQKNYDEFSDAYKRIRIAYIDGARDRPEEFQKRLNHFLQKTRENKWIGYGGIDKYYRL